MIRYLIVRLLDYVLQRALQVVEGEQRHVLVAKVKPQLANMRRYSSAYSKHLASSEYPPNPLSNTF
jgi:pumilio RNA-binding family